MRSAILISVGLIFILAGIGIEALLDGELTVRSASRERGGDIRRLDELSEVSSSTRSMSWNDWVQLGFGALGAISVVCGLIDRIVGRRRSK